MLKDFKPNNDLGSQGAKFDDKYSTGHCGYLELNLTKLPAVNMRIFAFVSFLLAVNLHRDIEASIVGEKLFDYGLKGAVVHSLLGFESIRLTFRVRKFILPWLVGGAATAIILESITVQSILSNLLAVGFITEADELLGLLIFTPKQKDSAKKSSTKQKMMKIRALKFHFGVHVYMRFYLR